MVRSTWSWGRKSPEGREFKPGLGYPTTRKFSLSFHKKMGTCFEPGEDTQREERGGLRLSYAVPKIQ